ncbi:MAG: 50S ribosomal protein L10 [Planctomycetota bacterium]
MPNLVNQILLADLERDFQKMGSCLVVSFDNLQPEQDIAIRGKLREVGVRYRVVRNRLASKAFAAIKLDLDSVLSGKCAIAIAEKEGAITAAKVLREYIKKAKASPIQIVGGVIEGTPYLGAAAQSIADLPDRATVQTMIAQAVSGPARTMATLLNAVAGGLARCIQARVDKGDGAA